MSYKVRFNATIIKRVLIFGILLLIVEAIFIIVYDLSSPYVRNHVSISNNRYNQTNVTSLGNSTVVSNGKGNSQNQNSKNTKGKISTDHIHRNEKSGGNFLFLDSFIPWLLLLLCFIWNIIWRYSLTFHQTHPFLTIIFCNSIGTMSLYTVAMILRFDYTHLWYHNFDALALFALSGFVTTSP